MKVRDPLRNIEVTLTEEERVRQWFISVLMNQCAVPVTLMNSEVGFNLADKHLRADVVVWDRQAKPLMVVECKAPAVEIDQKVLDQAIRYNMVLNPRWIVLTNGNKLFVLKKNGKSFAAADALPSYEEMTKLQ